MTIAKLSLAIRKTATRNSIVGFATLALVGCGYSEDEWQAQLAKYGELSNQHEATKKELADGRTVVADEAYLRRAIEEPGAEVVAGFQEGMPAYVGVLTDSQIESLVMYIRSLADPL